MTATEAADAAATNKRPRTNEWPTRDRGSGATAGTCCCCPTMSCCA